MTIRVFIVSMNPETFFTLISTLKQTCEWNSHLFDEFLNKTVAILAEKKNTQDAVINAFNVKLNVDVEQHIQRSYASADCICSCRLHSPLNRFLPSVIPQHSSVLMPPTSLPYFLFLVASYTLGCDRIRHHKNSLIVYCEQ